MACDMNRVKVWSRRFVSLYGTQLVYGKSKANPNRKGSIAGGSVKVDQSRPDRYQFKLSTPSFGSLYLRAASKAEMDDWIKAINRSLSGKTKGSRRSSRGTSDKRKSSTSGSAAPAAAPAPVAAAPPAERRASTKSDKSKSSSKRKGSKHSSKSADRKKSTSSKNSDKKKDDAKPKLKRGESDVGKLHDAGKVDEATFIRAAVSETVAAAARMGSMSLSNPNEPDPAELAALNAESIAETMVPEAAKAEEPKAPEPPKEAEKPKADPFADFDADMTADVKPATPAPPAELAKPATPAPPSETKKEGGADDGSDSDSSSYDSSYDSSDSSSSEEEAETKPPAAGSGPKTPPVLPKSYKVHMHSKSPKLEWKGYHMDNGSHIKIAVHEFSNVPGYSSSTLIDHKAGKLYLVWMPPDAEPMCKVQKHTKPHPPRDWLSQGSTYQGTATIRGILCDHWSVSNDFTEGEEQDIFLEAGKSPAVMVRTLQGFTLVDYSEWEEVEIPDSEFAPPKCCAGVEPSDG